MLLKILLVVMVIIALIAVETNKLRRVVIYLGIFSLISSFVYLLYSAPDVAIAEAIIGSTLATILYLVALKKYAVFTIYYLVEENTKVDTNRLMRSKNELLYQIETFCLEKELEAQVIYTPEDRTHIILNHAYDLIVEQKADSYQILGNRENYQLDELYKQIEKKSDIPVEFVREDFI